MNVQSLPSKPRARSAVMGLLALLAPVAFAASAAASGSATPQWRPLLDDTAAPAWRGWKAEDLPAGWQVDGGVLSKDGRVDDLVSRETFANFELELEWKIGKGGNSGVFIHGTREYDHVYWSAPEYQLLDDANAPDGSNRLTSAAAAYALYPSPAGVVAPFDQWNKTRIIVNGAHVEHWLNGQQVVTYELWSADWTARVKASKFSAYPHYGVAREGLIGIQGDHPGTLSIRNIRIRELASADLQPIGGLQAPEDMELLPDGRHILVSEMTDEKNQPGGFAMLDASSGAIAVITPETGGQPLWGDPRCRQRPASQLSPHGIHLSRLPDGALLLLAINHGDIESVHAYTLTEQQGRARLLWRGCVETQYNFNDVAATPDGFIGSHQFDKAKGEGPDAENFLSGGANTGSAVRWTKADGFRKIPGTAAAFPNGITVSSDGKTAWMAATAGRQLRKINLLRNTQVASAELPLAPDNLSWTADGQLLVTGSDDVHLLDKCAALTPPCTVPFSVAQIDPDSLQSRVIFRHDGTQLLGASVALIAGANIYIGSFTGNHVLKAPAPALSPLEPKNQ